LRALAIDLAMLVLPTPKEQVIKQKRSASGMRVMFLFPREGQRSSRKGGEGSKEPNIQPSKNYKHKNRTQGQKLEISSYVFCYGFSSIQ